MPSVDTSRTDTPSADERPRVEAASPDPPGRWSLYILENRLGQLYTGISTDVARRLREHQADGSRCARSLRGKGPLQLRLELFIGHHAEALRAERAVKRMTRAQRLALIERGQSGRTIDPGLSSTGSCTR